MPSDKILGIKKETVKEIKDKFQNSSAIIFVDYRGLSVAELTNIRKKLREFQSDIKIYKNTLTKIALNDLGIRLDDEHFEGPNAIAFATDLVQPLKILNDYARKNELLKLKIGIIDGIVSDKKALERIAHLPSREMLLAMVASGLMGVVRDLAICLKLVAEKKEQ